MATRTQTASPFWRWILIVSELLLGSYLIAMQVAGRHVRQETGAFLVVGICAGIAWVFLFFGSPFLVSSQRWLAILGWFIAAAAILFPVL
jgi:hypothetical protein